MNMVRSVLAGMFIAIAGVASAIAITGNTDIGIGKIVSGLIFSAGLLCTYMTSAHLFTGAVATRWNNRIMRYDGDTLKYVRDLSKIYLGNFIGACLILLIVPTLNSEVLNSLVAIGTNKVCVTNNAELVWVIKGILCNILVATGVMLSSKLAQNVAQLIVTITVPVALFVICGFEHSVANMFLLPASYLAGADISLISIAKCLIWVTTGNIIGGVFVGYYFYKLK